MANGCFLQCSRTYDYGYMFSQHFNLTIYCNVTVIYTELKTDIIEIKTDMSE